MMFAPHMQCSCHMVLLEHLGDFTIQNVTVILENICFTTLETNLTQPDHFFLLWSEEKGSSMKFCSGTP